MQSQNAPRRAFLGKALVSAALPAVVLARAAENSRSGAGQTNAPSPGGLTADSAGLTTYELGPQLWVRWNNRLVTCYRAHRSQKYPYFYPLAGPWSDLSLTAETSLPYPHHRSLFFACDRVNGANYWQEELSQGQVLSSGPRFGTKGSNSVEILDTCDWQRPGGSVTMRDERRLTVTVANPQVRFIDWEIRWMAVADVKVEKTNHSLLALRAAVELTPSGGGRLVNAEGESGEKATFGRKSAWCAFYGRRQGFAQDRLEGVALLDHPSNPWSPCPWFTRDYGFMSPTPMNFLDQPWTLAAGKAIELRYRVVLFGGTPEEAGLDRIYRAWLERG